MDAHPICVLDLKKPRDRNSTSTMVYHENKLSQILAKANGRRLAILGICGAERQGKSYFLSLLIHNLPRILGGQEPDLDISKRKDLFEFRNDVDRVTQGIWFWSQPFILPGEDDEIALFIMDTQGIFDMGSKIKDWVGLVGITVLTTSCVIYNTVSRIQENILQIFANFTKSALSQNLPEFTHAQFQKLIFLVRDFQHVGQFKAGATGGNKYLAQVMDLAQSSNMSPAAIETRNFLKKSFEQMDCFVLPSPGEGAKQLGFSGDVNDLDRDFSSTIASVLDRLCMPGAIPTKRNPFSKHPSTADEILQMFAVFVKQFNKSKDPLDSSGLYFINVQTSNEAAINTCIGLYERKMGRPFQSEETLNEIHSATLRDVLDAFAAIPKFGTEDEIRFFSNKLQDKLDVFAIQKRIGLKDESERVKKDMHQKASEMFRKLCEENRKDWTPHSLEEVLQSYVDRTLSYVEDQYRQKGIEGLDRSTIEDDLNEEKEVLQRKYVEQAKMTDAIVKSTYESIKKKITSKTATLSQTVGELLTPDMIKNIFATTTEDFQEPFLHDLLQTEVSENERNVAWLRITKSLETLQDTTISGYEDKKRKLHTLALRIAEERAMALWEGKNEPLMKACLARNLTESKDAAGLTILWQTEALEDFASQTSGKWYGHVGDEIRNELQSQINLSLADYKVTLLRLTKACEDLCEDILQAVMNRQNAKQDGRQALMESMMKQLGNRLNGAYNEDTSFSKLSPTHIGHLNEHIKQTASSHFSSGIDKMLLKLKEDDELLESSLHSCLDGYKTSLYEKSQNNSGWGIIQLEEYNSVLCNDTKNDLKKRIRDIISPFSTEQLMGKLSHQMSIIFNNFLRNEQEKHEEYEETLKDLYNLFLGSLKTAEEKLFPSDPNSRVHLYKPNELQERCDKIIASSRAFVLGCQQKRIPSNLVTSTQSRITEDKEKFLRRVVEENKTRVSGFTKRLKEKMHDILDGYLEELKKMESHTFNVYGTLAKETILMCKEKAKFLPSYEYSAEFLHDTCIKILSELHEESGTFLEPGQENMDIEYPSINAPGSSTSAFDFGTPTPTPAPRRKVAAEKPNTEEFCDTLYAACIDSVRQSVSMEKLDEEDLVQDFVKQLGNVEPEMLRNFVDKYRHNIRRILNKRRHELEQVKEAEVAVAKFKSKDAFSLYTQEFKKIQLSSKSPFFTPQQLNDIHKAAKNEVSRQFGTLGKDEDIRLERMMEEDFAKTSCTLLGSSEDQPAIGIDLGTTFSCMAIFWEGDMHVIPNEAGEKTTPSYVAFKEDGTTVVGQAAKKLAFLDPANTIFDAKRLLGRAFNDPMVQNDIQSWPFSVVEEVGRCKIQLQNGTTLLPEQIGSKILFEFRQLASHFLKREVINAVITVPAYFNDGQRQATRDAGVIAGWNVLRIINEPTAAAFAYSLIRENPRMKRNVLIFDLGGGTFDISLLSMVNSVIDTVAVNGDTHLGGEDFDTQLMLHCAQQFQAQHGIDLMDKSGDFVAQQDAQRRIRRMRKACEDSKIHLSSLQKVVVSLECVYEALELHVEVTRETFEALNSALFQRTMDLTHQTLVDAKLGPEHIDEVVLVGGSTRIPKVQELLRQLFTKAPVSQSINPDEAVACGAALQAAVTTGNLKAQIDSGRFALDDRHKDLVDIKISDVHPHSTGVELEDGSMAVMIPKNSTIPTTKKETFVTAFDNQTSVLIVIYEGENVTQAAANHKVGEFYLNGIPPSQAGEQRIEVTMWLDTEGILRITAVCDTNGTTKELNIREHKGRMSAAEKTYLMEVA